MMLQASSSRATARVSRKGALPRRAPRVVAVHVRAEKSGLAKLSESMGMPTDDGYFGFTPFSEVWVGRWSMIGFVSSIVVEFVTGKGTLAQVGLEAPSAPLFAAMVVLFGGATVAGMVVTVQQLLSKKMSRTQLERYRSFLGLTKQDDWMSDNAARNMKRRPDFASPGLDMAAIEEARRQGMPADRFLAVGGAEAEAQRGAEDMKSATTTAVMEEARDAAAASTSAPSQLSQQETANQLYGLNEVQYARDVELANGRAAMLGFLAAIMVEAATGKGIILQIIAYLKWSGLLGPMSGF